jgi:hypothetical protein
MDPKTVRDVALKSFAELELMRWGVEANEKRMELVVELALLVQNNAVLSRPDKVKLLEQFLGGIEGADDEKQRIMAEIMAEAQRHFKTWMAHYAAEKARATAVIARERALACTPAEALQYFKDCVGMYKAGWDGVTRREDGEIVSIIWNAQELGGALSDAFIHCSVSMPYLIEVDLSENRSLKGTLVTLPPPRMKTFNIADTAVKIDVAAIEWPANATAIVYGPSSWSGLGYEEGLVCRITDHDKHKAGEIRFKCNQDQVFGDINKLVLPNGMQTVNFQYCTGLTGKAESEGISEDHT